MTIHSQHSGRRTAMLGMGTVAAAVIAFLQVPSGAGALAETISGTQAEQVVAVADIQSHDGLVTGRLVNKTDQSLRDVKVLIGHTWFWKNERRPGHDSPSRSDFYVVPGVIPPHGSVMFQYRTASPLPERPDGRFKASVTVTSFTEMSSQQVAR